MSTDLSFRSEVLSAYTRSAYRVAGAIWPGGKHRVEVVSGPPSTESFTWGARWGARDSTHRLYVRPTWPTDVLARGATCVGGMLTLDLGKEILPSVFRATWVEQGRGTRLSDRHGFLVERAGGWRHADTLAEARSVLQAPPPLAAPEGVDRFSAQQLLRSARLSGEEIVTSALAFDNGRGVSAAGMRDWCARRGFVLEERKELTAGELAALATESRDRVAHVYRVLVAVWRAANRRTVSAA